MPGAAPAPEPVAMPVPAVAPYAGVVGDAGPAPGELDDDENEDDGVDELDNEGDGVDERWPYEIVMPGEPVQASPRLVIAQLCQLVHEMDGARIDHEVALGSELDALRAFPCERHNVVAFAAGEPSPGLQNGKLCALSLDLVPD